MPTEVLPTGPAEGSGVRDSADSFLREAAAISDRAPGAFLPATGLKEGEVFADRFVIERLAGHGGMGAVYRALDRMTGAPVALKVMARRGQDDDRFAQEARVLSELTHPAVVRYVAHGSTSRGEPFLAMEWLEGEDLAQRLARAGLSVGESVTVAHRVAEGLAAAHARGIVHRDVKPSNVFLVGGDPARARLIDFGIVRLKFATQDASGPPMTRTGIILGTVGYMSPEQATADRALDARADVFALGCLLFECLTGQPAFSGAHVVAVLAKVLREEAPRVRQLRPELSVPLDDLVTRMISKDKRGRPADGGAVLLELEALGSVAGGVPEVAVRSSVGLSGGEQRFLSVMLTVVPDQPDRAKEIVQRHGGDPARLANGALLVTLSSRGHTSEQVVAAAVCALELRQAFPSARIALATGRVQTTGQGPPGPVIDQAAALLAQSASPGIRIDRVTAGLLGDRFGVQADGHDDILLGWRSDAEAPRTLLGKPTPHVGRDKELTLLEGTLHECVEESVARAVLVTGPPGQGKSRLRHEFVNKARERGVAILMARADPVGAGSAFMMVRQLVRQAAGLREGDPGPEQHIKLRSYLADLCRGDDCARIADFLGELVAAPSIDRPSPQLRAARNDPQIMAVWLARSFGEWLAAECAARPLLVVLEDLHWGDLPSVTYLGEGLRVLGARPLMVLALARPEVRDSFPGLWPGAEKIEVHLGRLTPRAAERLVRSALGETAAPDAVTRIVERADGNAFFLEELIRRVAEGDGDTLPETVIALVESRLERLEAQARRIVRAASVFGEVFWRGGVMSLLGGDGDAQDLDAWLGSLAGGEVISLARDSRYPGEVEYTFRHGLLREAAYAMLTAEDRITGHRLAAEWLERAGEKNALTMADHFERGQEPKRAIRWIVRAAQVALDGGNTEATIALGYRGVGCGAAGAERGFLRQVQGTALFMRGEMMGSVEMSREAMGLLAPGSTPWFVSAAFVFYASVFLGDPKLTAPVLQAIMNVPVQPESSGPYGLAVNRTCLGLAFNGQLGQAFSLLKRAEAIRETSEDLVFAQWLRTARGFLETIAEDLGSAVVNLYEGRSLADRTGDALGRGAASMYIVMALASTGHCDRTETAFRETLSFCEPRGLRTYCDWGAVGWARGMLFVNRGAEAIPWLSKLLDLPDRRLATIARASLAEVLVQISDLPGAEREAARSLESASTFPIERCIALGALARIELCRGRAAEAIEFAERGLDSESRAPSPWSSSLLRLTRAEALHALGRTDEAHVAIAQARDRVLRVAATLDGDPELRESYLTSIVANARTIELARQWLGAESVVADG